MLEKERQSMDDVAWFLVYPLKIECRILWWVDWNSCSNSRNEAFWVHVLNSLLLCDTDAMWCNVYMYIYNYIILLYMDILGQLSMLAVFVWIKFGESSYRVFLGVILQSPRLGKLLLQSPCIKGTSKENMMAIYRYHGTSYGEKEEQWCICGAFLQHFCRKLPMILGHRLLDDRMSVVVPLRMCLLSSANSILNNWFGALNASFSSFRKKSNAWVPNQ